MHIKYSLWDGDMHITFERITLSQNEYQFKHAQVTTLMNHGIHYTTYPIASSHGENHEISKDTRNGKY